MPDLIIYISGLARLICIEFNIYCSSINACADTYYYGSIQIIRNVV
jgi:hypothetical protein